MYQNLRLHEFRISTRSVRIASSPLLFIISNIKRTRNWISQILPPDGMTELAKGTKRYREGERWKKIYDVLLPCETSRLGGGDTNTLNTRPQEVAAHITN